MQILRDNKERLSASAQPLFLFVVVKVTQETLTHVSFPKVSFARNERASEWIGKYLFVSSTAPD